MSFLSRLKMSLARFMQGRNGTDNLCMFTLVTGLVLSLAASFLGLPLLSFAGLGLYIYTIFRMFSRNREKRMSENRKYLALTSGWRTKVRQFVRRMQNRKEYKYFKCPNCKLLLRMKKGTGDKEITCVRCNHQFHQKA